MWTCLNCQNENEENFKFCWNCGLTRPAQEIPAAPPKKIETVKPIEPVKREIVEDKPKPPEIHKTYSGDEDEDDVLPMLARVAGVEHKKDLRDEDISLERKVFTIAVRLVGLFLIYQVLVALPDLAVMVYSAMSGDSAEELFTRTFIIPLSKLLFYLIAGIYLIASGEILIRLLPRR